MAIQGNYDISTAGGAYKAWYNYNYGGNTLGVTAEDISTIQSKYSKEINTTWTLRATNDNNQYVISDDEKNESHNDGVERGKDKSGHDGSTDGVSSVTAGVVGAGVGGLAGGVLGVIATITSLSKGAMTKPGAMTLSKTITAAAVGAALTASGTYLITAKPNEDPANACETLTEEMGVAQGEIADQEGIMEEADQTLEELSAEAEEANEEANSENEDNYANYDDYKVRYDELMEKVKSGTPLTDEEKEELKGLIPILQELGVNIQETTDETSDVVGEIYDEMGEYQDTFDDASEKIEEINGLTDFAAEFDEATKDNAKMVEATAAIGMLGAAGITTSGGLGLTAGLKKIAYGKSLLVGGAPIIAYGTAQTIAAGIATAEGITAGLEFNKVREQQQSYAEKAETEIAAREATQDLNSNLSDVYDERVEGYEGYLGVVEDLELEVPEGMEVPEEGAELPPEVETPPETNQNGQDDDPNKKPDDKDK